MIQYAGTGYFIEKVASSNKGLESTAIAKTPRDLVEHASRFGVSRWVNPILLFPLEPLVLVEGKFDRDFLFECLNVLRISVRPRIACLEDLKSDPSKGGVESLISFIKENASVIRARHPYAKVCALIDWDSSGKVPGISALFKQSEPFVAMAWDVTEANPNEFYATNCRGIERFYPDSTLDAAMKYRPEIFYKNNVGVTVIKKDESFALKKLLNEIVTLGLVESDTCYAKPLISRLVASLK